MSLATEKELVVPTPVPRPVAARAEGSLRLTELGALLCVYVIWGSTYYAIRVALVGCPPFLLAGTRFLIAGTLLYGYLRVRGVTRPPLAEWGAAARVGFLLLVVGNGAVTYAERWVSSSLAAVVVATMPLWAALFARFLGQKPTHLEWLGLSVGFVGVVVLNLGGELRGHGLPALVLAVAPLSWALGSVWSRRLPLPKGPMATATEMLTAGVILIGFGLLRAERLTAWPPLSSTLAFAYLVVFGSLVAFSAYVYLLGRVRPTVATSYAYVNPLIAIGLGVGLGKEQIGALTWVASAVIVAGVALISLGARPRR